MFTLYKKDKLLLKQLLKAIKNFLKLRPLKVHVATCLFKKSVDLKNPETLDTLTE